MILSFILYAYAYGVFAVYSAFSSASIIGEKTSDVTIKDLAFLSVLWPILPFLAVKHALNEEKNSWK